MDKSILLKCELSLGLTSPQYLMVTSDRLEDKESVGLYKLHTDTHDGFPTWAQEYKGATAKKLFRSATSNYWVIGKDLGSTGADVVATSVYSAIWPHDERLMWGAISVGQVDTLELSMLVKEEKSCKYSARLMQSSSQIFDCDMF